MFQHIHAKQLELPLRCPDCPRISIMPDFVFFLEREPSKSGTDICLCCRVVFIKDDVTANNTVYAFQHHIVDPVL